MNQDLAIIKKKYGEKMMHLCRSLFPSILEQPGLLSDILLTSFEPTKFLYDDIIDNKAIEKFKNYINSFIEIEEEQEISIYKTPQELLNEAGYILYECKTEEEIQRFKKYYSKGEELCTFNGGRLERCFVFFAIKKNVSEIKRENFINPQRQDEYGTSVISIQFAKGEQNTLSIKNRYNHTVINPDATFSNNLDNIIEGLTESFARAYNMNCEVEQIDFEIPGYVRASDGKYYKYNYEINNIYYCPNNIIIDNFRVIRDYAQKEKYIIADYFIIDLVNKKIDLYDRTLIDSFTDGLKDIKNIKVINENEDKRIEIQCNNQEHVAIIKLDKTNKIIEYSNKNLTKIGNQFLNYNIDLRKINLPNLEVTGQNFLCNNKALTSIDLPNLQQTEFNFLFKNKTINEINMPNLKEVGAYFLAFNRDLTWVNLPNIEKVGDDFLILNEKIKKMNMPKLKEVKSNFLQSNKELIEIELPSLEKTGAHFLSTNKKIKRIEVPKLEIAGNHFLYHNKELISVNMPSLRKAYDHFLSSNEKIETVNMPRLYEIGGEFLYKNKSITSKEFIKIPSLPDIGRGFLEENQNITKEEKESFKRDKPSSPFFGGIGFPFWAMPENAKKQNSTNEKEESKNEQKIASVKTTTIKEIVVETREEQNEIGLKKGMVRK